MGPLNTGLEAGHILYTSAYNEPGSQRYDRGLGALPYHMSSPKDIATNQYIRVAAGVRVR